MKEPRRAQEGGFDWHAWLRTLSPGEKRELTDEVLAARSRTELGEFARRYYLHFCTDTEDDKLRGLEREFVLAQMDGCSEEDVGKIEDEYFRRAKELLKLAKEGTDGT